VRKPKPPASPNRRLLVRSGVRAGTDARQVELDHLGAYNFSVEIAGVTADYIGG
jgi:hypothetical protein